jgi:pheromone shutdown protein TraB
MAADAAFYARMGHFGDDEDPAGARLLMRWHERNTFILTSLLEVIEPGDRVLVLYGAGHLTHLSRLIGDDPTLRLRRLEELVGEKR